MFARLAIAVLLWLLPASVHAGALDAANAYSMADLDDPKALVRHFNLYATAVKEDPRSYEATWKAAKFAYYVWQKAAPKAERLDVAKTIILYGRKATELNADGAEGWHWLAIGIGALGLTQGVLNSMQLVPEFRKNMERSIELDPDYYESSGMRNLARMYTLLPGMPVSIGSDAKAKELLDACEKKYPNFSLTYLYLADWYWKRGDKKEALAMLDETERRHPKNEGEIFFAPFVARQAVKVRKMIQSDTARGLFDPMTD